MGKPGRGDTARSQGIIPSSIAPSDSPGNRRVVKTARTLDEINAAAREGYRPLVRPVQPGPDIHFMMAVYQDPETGEVELSGDVRHRGGGEKVIDYTLYYPYHFPNPFAAYLLPKDLAVGEEVWLEDLIEDLVAVWGNQGYHPRLAAAPAVWNGSDFEIRFDPDRDSAHWIG